MRTGVRQGVQVGRFSTGGFGQFYSGANTKPLRGVNAALRGSDARRCGVDRRVAGAVGVASGAKAIILLTIHCEHERDAHYDTQQAHGYDVECRICLAARKEHTKVIRRDHLLHPGWKSIEQLLAMNDLIGALRGVANPYEYY